MRDRQEQWHSTSRNMELPLFGGNLGFSVPAQPFQPLVSQFNYFIQAQLPHLRAISEELFKALQQVYSSIQNSLKSMRGPPVKSSFWRAKGQLVAEQLNKKELCHDKTGLSFTKHMSIENQRESLPASISPHGTFSKSLCARQGMPLVSSGEGKKED